MCGVSDSTVLHSVTYQDRYHSFLGRSDSEDDADVRRFVFLKSPGFL